MQEVVGDGHMHLIVGVITMPLATPILRHIIYLHNHLIRYKTIGEGISGMCLDPWIDPNVGHSPILVPAPRPSWPQTGTSNPHRKFQLNGTAVRAGTTTVR